MFQDFTSEHVLKLRGGFVNKLWPFKSDYALIECLRITRFPADNFIQALKYFRTVVRINVIAHTNMRYPSPGTQILVQA
jgi:hypothetical protein